MRFDPTTTFFIVLLIGARPAAKARPQRKAKGKKKR